MRIDDGGKRQDQMAAEGTANPLDSNPELLDAALNAFSAQSFAKPR
jgi:hypothetical protein